MYLPSIESIREFEAKADENHKGSSPASSTIYKYLPLKMPLYSSLLQLQADGP